MKWKDLLEPSSIPIALTGFVLAFSYSGILSFIPIYAKELGLADIASYFFILYALVVVISRPFTGKISIASVKRTCLSCYYFHNWDVYFKSGANAILVPWRRYANRFRLWNINS